MTNDKEHICGGISNSNQSFNKEDDQSISNLKLTNEERIESTTIF